MRLLHSTFIVVTLFILAAPAESQSTGSNLLGRRFFQTHLMLKPLGRCLTTKSAGQDAHALKIARRFGLSGVALLSATVYAKFFHSTPEVVKAFDTHHTPSSGSWFCDDSGFDSHT